MGNPKRRHLIPHQAVNARKAPSFGAFRVVERLAESPDGLTTTAIANEANAARSQALTLIRELGAAGCIRGTGARRATC
jgi:hypothetical protein